MTDPTLIADLIRAGLTPDLVGRVAVELQKSFVEGANSVRGFPVEIPTDNAAERRREYDRNRKRKQRLSGGIPRKSADSAECPNPALIYIEEDNQKEEKKESKKERGSRLSADWSPDDFCRSFAVERGMSASRISTEVEKFRNYWTAKTGAAATKRDWLATWRNWVISSLERIPGDAPKTSIHAPRHGDKLSDGLTYLKSETHEFDAWAAHYRSIGQKHPPTYFHQGWKFPARWPPSVRPVSAEKEKAA